MSNEVHCPLCEMETDPEHQALESCTCGYQICSWCWAQIIQEAEGRYPVYRELQASVQASSSHGGLSLQQQPAGRQSIAGGEIAEVRGDHRRPIGSNVHTAKGLLSRRITLATHTANKVYDIQHRLGLDRPTNAVDWLIHNAKATLDLNQ